MRSLAAALAATAPAVGPAGLPQGWELALLQGGMVHACNGALYARQPAPLPETLPPLLVPHALLQAACQAIPTAAQLTLQHKGSRLLITGGSFSARLPTVPGDQCAWMPNALDAPQLYMPATLAYGLGVACGFAEPKAETGREWMCGVRIEAGYTLATNGIAAIRAPGTGTINPMLLPVTLPLGAVIEINKRLAAYIDDPGTLPGMAITETHATFHFADGGVLRTSVIPGAWPRPHDKLFEPLVGAELVPLPAGLYEAVRAVAPFCTPETRPLVTLHPRGAVSANEDAEVDGFTPNLLRGTYRAEYLGRALQIATHIKLTDSMCLWRNEQCAGLLMGTRG